MCAYELFKNHNPDTSHLFLPEVNGLNSKPEKAVLLMGRVSIRGRQRSKPMAKSKEAEYET